MEYKYKLGFLGAGNMAKAIASGVLSSKLLNKDQMIMSRQSENGSFEGIKITTDNNFILNNCEYVVLAVKPQIFNSLKETGLFSSANCACVISIMAGVKAEKIESVFTNGAKVVRVMPNTPCAVGLGMVCIAKNGATKEQNEFCEKIFKGTAKTALIDENLFDAVTSISGSGPAYVYYFIKSMIDAGVEGGLSLEDSKLLTLQTVVGAAKMVETSSDDLSTLIQKVCSKGGTTIQAIDTFNNYEIDKKINEGIQKCRLRSEELSK